MAKRLELTGKRFGRYVVIGFDRIENGRTVWNCICDCGSKRKVVGLNLSNGHSKSCGCYAWDQASRLNRTHGKTDDGGSKEYRTWKSMKERCYFQSNKSYKIYGGRGIKVCDHWKNSFENFLQDMGMAPSSLHTIDRINSNGNYEPENCRWATVKEQSRNRCTNVFSTYNGEKLCALDWSKRLGIPIWSVLRRIKEGWDVPKIKSHYL